MRREFSYDRVVEREGTMGRDSGLEVEFETGFVKVYSGRGILYSL